jgi:hypothetical protein
MYYFDLLDGSADEFKTHPNPFANGGDTEYLLKHLLKWGQVLHYDKFSILVVPLRFS